MQAFGCGYCMEYTQQIALQDCAWRRCGAALQPMTRYGRVAHHLIQCLRSAWQGTTDVLVKAKASAGVKHGSAVLARSGVA